MADASRWLHMLIPPEVEQTRIERHPGFRIIRPWSGGPPLVQVERRTAELVRYLESTDEIHLSVGDDVEGGLDFVVPHGDRIRGLTGGDGAARLLPHTPNLEYLDYFGDGSSLDLRILPRLKRLLTLEPPASLAGAPLLEELWIDRLPGADLTQLGGLAHLRSLYVREPRRLASLHGIESLPLQELRLVAPQRLQSLDVVGDLGALRTFELRGGRSVRDPEAIGGARTLRRLQIESGPAFASLEWVRGLAELEELELESTRVGDPPVDLDPLGSLRNLRILKLYTDLRGAAGIEALGRLRSLRVLGIDRGPEIGSLDFLRGLAELEELWISRTPVRDGDMTPILDLPGLKRLHALDPQRRHYSHGASELMTAIRARHPLPLPGEIDEARRAGGAALSRLYGRAGRFMAELAGEAPAVAADRTARPGGGRKAVSTPPPVPALSLLGELEWRFDIPLESEAEVRELLRESEQGPPPDHVVPVGERVRIRIAEFPGEILELRAAGGEFSAAELLFQLHQHVFPLVAGTDYVHFEGLVPGEEGQGRPDYVLLLGS